MNATHTERKIIMKKAISVSYGSSMYVMYGDSM